MGTTADGRLRTEHEVGQGEGISLGFSNHRRNQFHPEGFGFLAVLVTAIGGVRQRFLPYPSPADILWVVGNAPLLLGLFLGHRSLGVRLSPRQRSGAVGVYAVLLMLLAGGLLAPMYFSQPGVPWAEAFVGTCYLVGDLTFAFIATLSLVVLWDGLIGRPWLPIVIGALLFAISDRAFTYAVWIGVYSTGANLLSSAIDVSYLAAYAAIALGAYRQVTLRLPTPTDLHKASASRA